jgi:hypothetical protein
MKAYQAFILSPLGRGEPRIQLRLKVTPALLSKFHDRNKLEDGTQVLELGFPGSSVDTVVVCHQDDVTV